MVSWPMRSRGEKVLSVFSIERRSGCEGEVGRVGVEDRVVVAAAELEGDCAGDGLGDPALGGFAEHDGLGVEPAALVEQAAELAAVVAVLLDGVFVVDAGDEALVGDEEQREAGGFVDAAGLGFDDAVFDLVAHAEAVAAADALASSIRATGRYSLAVEGDGEAFFEGDGDFFGLDGDVARARRRCP